MKFSTFLGPRNLITAALLSSLCCFGQNNVLSVAPPEKVVAKAGASGQFRTSLELRTGYHCNSNKPTDEYLIPLKLTWASGPLESPEVIYPTPQMEKFSFSVSDQPLSVYTGKFELITKFKIPSSAMAGQVVATGKLTYQACTDRLCLPRKTIDVSIPIDIIK